MTYLSLQEEEDGATKEWLVNVMSNQRMGSVISAHASRRFSAFDRPRKSILGALARFSSAQPASLEQAHEQVRSSLANSQMFGAHLLWAQREQAKNGLLDYMCHRAIGLSQIPLRLVWLCTGNLVAYLAGLASFRQRPATAGDICSSGGAGPED